MRGISPKFLRWNKFFFVLFLAFSYPLVQANTDSLSMQQRMNRLDEQSDIHRIWQTKKANCFMYGRW